jgi:fluoride exporter
MYKLALIGLGGLLGTLLRYWLSQAIDERSHSSFPYGTMIVNLAGCFAAGFLFHFLGQTIISPDLRLAIFTGFLGGFTTFSAYALQTLVLTQSSMLSLAVVNVLASNALGLAMVWLGAGVSRFLVSVSG